MSKVITNLRKSSGIIIFITSILFLLTFLLPALQSNFYIAENDYTEIKNISYFVYVFGGTSTQYSFNFWGLFSYVLVIAGGIIALRNDPNSLFYAALMILASAVFFVFTKTIFLGNHSLTFIHDLYKVLYGYYITFIILFLLAIFSFIMSFYSLSNKKKK